MRQYIKEVARGKRGSKDLTYEQSCEAARLIIEERATAAQIAAFLIGQRIKTESSDELLAFVHEYESRTEKLKVNEGLRESVVDYASPYTGRNSFAATIPVSILLAEQGLPAFLHSSDSLPPKYGTSLKDILSKLGINVDASVREIENNLNQINIGFACTDKFCKPLSAIRMIREEIEVRTIYNTVEKLLNISNAQSIMLGAFHKTAINKLTPIFKNLPFKKVFIVQGVEGSEDLPVYRNSFIYKINGDDVESFIVNPNDYGFHFSKEEGNKALNQKEQAEIIISILKGNSDKNIAVYQSQVIYNAGIRLFLFGYCATISEGIKIAIDKLNRGVGMALLEKWKTI